MSQCLSFRTAWLSLAVAGWAGLAVRPAVAQVVYPALAVTTQRVEVTIPQGTTYMTPYFFHIWNNATTDEVAFSMSANTGWLTAEPATGVCWQTPPAYGSLIFNFMALAPGSYTGQVFVGSGAATNTPLVMDVLLTITPEPSVPQCYPTTVRQQVRVLSDQAVIARLQVWNAGTGSMPYTVSESADWLTVAPTNGFTTNNDVQAHTLVFTNYATYSPGSYYAQVHVADDAWHSRHIDVELQVLPPPAALGLSTSRLAAATSQGDAPTEQTLQVWNAGGGGLDYSFQSTAGWLSISPTNGASFGETNAHTVAFDPTGMGPGSHAAALLVFSTNLGLQPVAVPVTLAVAGRPAVIGAWPNPMGLTVAAGSGPSTQLLEVVNIGIGAMAYTVAADAGWLAVAPTNGALGPNGRQMHAVRVDVNALVEGCRTGRLVVASPDANPGSVTVAVVAAIQPVLALDPLLLTNTVAPGANAAAQVLRLRNAGSTNALAFEIRSDAPWVRLSPTSGVVAAAPLDITVTYLSSNLMAGLHPARIVARAPVAGMDPAAGAAVAEISLGVRPVAGTFAEKIVFAANPAGNLDLWTMDPDGTDLALLLQRSGDQTEPRISPDGFQLAFRERVAGTNRVVVRDLVTGLESTGPDLVNLHWLADSRGVLGVTTNTSRNDLMIFYPAAGSNAMLYIGADHRQAFGYDSANDLLYYTQDPGWPPNTRIYEAVPSNGAVRVIFGADGRHEKTGRLSRDGTYLCYAKSDRLDQPPYRLCVLGVLTNRGPEWRFASSAGFAEREPDFSPARDRLVFARDVGGTNTALCAIDLASEAVTTLQQAAWRHEFPTWGVVYQRPPPIPWASPTNAAMVITNGCTNTWTWAWQVRNAGPGAMSYAVSNATPWLTIDPVSGVSTGEIDTVTLVGQAEDLAAGAYTGRVTLLAAGATSPAPVLVARLVVQPRLPLLQVAPSNFTCVAVAGTNAVVKTLSVWNGGGGQLSYTVAVNRAWLTAAPAGGTLGTGDSAGVTMICNPAGLATGVYYGAVTVTAAGVVGSPRIVAARLIVQPAPTPAPPVLELAPGGLTNAVHRTRDATNQEFYVRNGGSGVMLFKFGAHPDWLTLQPANLYHQYRMNDGGEDEITVQYRTHGLAEGVYTGRIWIVASGLPSNAVTVVMTVLPRPRYRVGYSAAPSAGGWVSAAPAPGPDGLYEEGQRLVLTAHTADNYDFTGWGGQARGNNPVWDMFVMQPQTNIAKYEHKTIIWGLVNNTGNGIVITNVTVTFGGVSGTTDTHGRYRLDDVPVAPFGLTASKNGYDFQMYPNYTPLAHTNNRVDFAMPPHFFRNLVARQRPESKWVDITYDLQDNDNPFHTMIAVEARTGNASPNWVRPAVRGDYGHRVPLGRRQIQWYAGTDFDHQNWPFMEVRLSADGDTETATFSLDTRGEDNWLMRAWSDRNGNNTYDPGEELAGAEVFYDGRDAAHRLGVTAANGTLRIAARSRRNAQIFVRKAIHHQAASKTEHAMVSNRIFTVWLDSDIGGADNQAWNGVWQTRLVEDADLDAIGRGETLNVRLAHPVFEWHLKVAVQTADTNFLARLRASLARSSEYFYDVTDGQMKLGMIAITSGVVLGSAAWTNADVLVPALNGTVPSATVNGYTMVGTNQCITLGLSRRFNGVNQGPITRPFDRALIHELGHYVLGFYDEYDNGLKVPFTAAHRAARANEMPANYGMMDNDTAITELSSFNDYEAGVYGFGSPRTNITEQIYYRDLRNTANFFPCWQWLESLWQIAYSGIPVEIIVPQPGRFQNGVSTSPDRAGPETTYNPYGTVVNQAIPAPYHLFECIQGNSHTFPTRAGAPLPDATAGCLAVRVLQAGRPVPGVTVALRAGSGARAGSLGQTDLAGELFTYDAAAGDVLEATRHGVALRHAVTAVDLAAGAVVLEWPQSPAADAARPGSIPFGFIVAGALQSAGDGVPLWHARFQCSTEITRPPAATLYRNDQDPESVSFTAAGVNLYTALVDFAGAQLGSLALSCDPDSGTPIFAFDNFQFSRLAPQGEQPAFSRNGWVVLTPYDGFVRSDTYALVYEGTGPAPRESGWQQVGSWVFAALPPEQVNLASGAVLVWYYDVASMVGLSATTLQLHAWNEVEANWRAVPCEVSPREAFVSAVVTNLGAFALFAAASSDTNPPAAINDLLASPGDRAREVRLQWTATGGDGTNGVAQAYALRFADLEITTANWADASEYPLVRAPLPAGSPEEAVVSLPGADQRYYFALRAVDDAGNWSDLGPGTAARTPFDDANGNGLPDDWEATVNLGRATPMGVDEDVDGDGLTTRDEYELATNPNAGDTDGDGMGDGWESSHGLNPSVAADAALDSDGDTLLNLDEYLGNTNPQSADSDGDGMTDPWELEMGLDPTTAAEDFGGQADPDQDRFDNYSEYVADTQPTNSHSKLEITDVTPDLELELQTSGRRSYRLQCVTNVLLESWPEQAAFPGTGGVVARPLTNAADISIYRIAVPEP